MVRYWVVILWLLLLILIQVAITPAMLPAGARPDWILVFSVLLGFLAGPSYGLAGGAIGGLLLDLFTGRFIGLHTLLKAGMGWACGQITRHVYREYPSVALVAVAAAVFVQEMIAVIVLWGFGVRIPVAHTFDQLPPLISYSLVAGALIYPILYSQTAGPGGRIPGEST